MVRSIVQRYIGCVNYYDEVDRVSREMRKLLGPFPMNNDISFKGSSGTVSTDKETFRKTVLKAAWEYVFRQFDMERFMTKSLMADVNKFVEKQVDVPFTMKNIHKVIDIVAQTHAERMDQVLMTCYDRITKHTHENRYQVEGFKTNKTYLIGKKIIFTHMISVGYSAQPELQYSRWDNDLIDFVKAICYITGDNFREMKDLRNLYSGENFTEEEMMASDKFVQQMTKECVYMHKEHGRNPPTDSEIHDYIVKNSKSNYHQGRYRKYKSFGKWYDWTYFELRAYKKGTLHVRFKDDKVWAIVNRRIAKINKWPLPEKL